MPQNTAKARYGGLGPGGLWYGGGRRVGAVAVLREDRRGGRKLEEGGMRGARLLVDGRQLVFFLHIRFFPGSNSI